MERALLFVYGTLKRGKGNHYFLEKAKFLGEAKTVEKFALYDIGVPAVKDYPPLYQIRGELYLVDTTTLSIIDALEGHPTVYIRTPVQVECKGKTYWAWIYIYRRPIKRREPLKSGEW
jgi:gamma-glutamylaminecyclotransferase